MSITEKLAVLREQHFGLDKLPETIRVPALGERRDETVKPDLKKEAVGPGTAAEPSPRSKKLPPLLLQRLPPPPSKRPSL